METGTKRNDDRTTIRRARRCSRGGARQDGDGNERRETKVESHTSIIVEYLYGRVSPEGGRSRAQEPDSAAGARGSALEALRRLVFIEGSCSGRRSRGLHRVSKMTGLRKRGSSGGSMGFGVRDESYRPLRSTGRCGSPMNSLWSMRFLRGERTGDLGLEPSRGARQEPLEHLEEGRSSSLQGAESLRERPGGQNPHNSHQTTACETGTP